MYRTYPWQNTGKNITSTGTEAGFAAFAVLLRTLVVILLQSDVHLPSYERKHCFTGFETGFTAFALLF